MGKKLDNTLGDEDFSFPFGGLTGGGGRGEMELED